MNGSPAEGIDLLPVLRKVLTTRGNSEIDNLAKKLDQQGINQTSSLKVLSKSFLERKRSEKWASDGLGDVADVMEVWTALQQSNKGKGKAGNSKGSSKGKKGGRSSRGRSRSPRGRDQQRGHGATPRSSSKTSLGGRSSRYEEPLPLWTAIIEEDVNEVQRLLQQGVNIELRHQNRTPLMAACERGHFWIAQLLLDKGADTSAVNRKGRCALSFAAAPSKDEQQKDQRPSQLDIIKLLSHHGAKIHRKDDRGRTPRAHAETGAKAPATRDPRWKRAQAAQMLADLENA